MHIHHCIILNKYSVTPQKGDYLQRSNISPAANAQTRDHRQQLCAYNNEMNWKKFMKMSMKFSYPLLSTTYGSLVFKHGN